MAKATVTIKIGDLPEIQKKLEDAAEMITDLKRQLAEANKRVDELEGELAEVTRNWINIKNIAVGLCNSVTRFREDTEDTYDRLSSALTPPATEGCGRPQKVAEEQECIDKHLHEMSLIKSQLRYGDEFSPAPQGSLEPLPPQEAEAEHE